MSEQEQSELTATEQGAAPDRLQLRSLRSFLASVTTLPAAGELGRWPAARSLDLAATFHRIDKIGAVEAKTHGYKRMSALCISKSQHILFVRRLRWIVESPSKRVAASFARGSVA